MSTAMNTSTKAPASSCRRSEVLAWSAVVLVLGVVVPGGGLLVAVVLFFTLLRANRTSRVVLLVLGALLAYVSFTVLLPYGGQEGSGVGEPVLVEPDD